MLVNNNVSDSIESQRGTVINIVLEMSRPYSMAIQIIPDAIYLYKLIRFKKLYYF